MDTLAGKATMAALVLHKTVIHASHPIFKRWLQTQGKIMLTAGERATCVANAGNGGSLVAAAGAACKSNFLVVARSCQVQRLH